MPEVTTAPPETTQRRRKVQAILAGGIVLGIGAIVTLAAWNDSEFADGIFGAAAFDLEGSTDGENFEQHSTADGAAELAFAANNLIPGETVYAPFWVRLDNDTSVDGTIEENDGIGVVASDGANTEHLSYTVYADPETCDDDGATTGTEVASGADLSEGVGSSATIDLSAGSGNEPGAAVQLCFVVEADADDLEQGEPAEATWEVLATSLEG